MFRHSYDLRIRLRELVKTVLRITILKTEELRTALGSSKSVRPNFSQGFLAEVYSSGSDNGIGW